MRPKLEGTVLFSSAELEGRTTSEHPRLGHGTLCKLIRLSLNGFQVDQSRAAGRVGTENSTAEHIGNPAAFILSIYGLVLCSAKLSVNAVVVLRGSVI